MLCQIRHKLFLSKIPGQIKNQIMADLTLENPKWLENIKMGRSTYKVPRHLKFYSNRTCGGLIVPRGYGQQLARICAKYGQVVEYDDQRRLLSEIELDFAGVLRPYQDLACAQILRRRFATLCAPTGAGKTVCGLYLVAKRRQPALIIVHTRDLAWQWVERIEQFLNISPQDVGMIGGGRSKIGQAITVATVQSVYSRAKELKKHIGHVLVDECHRAPSRTFTQAVTAFDSAYMLGLSATPFRRDGLTQLIFWHLGELAAEIDSQALMDSGAILRPEIIVRETEFTTRLDPAEEYGQIVSDLTEDAKRNELIIDEVAKEMRAGSVCLVLSDRKTHCQDLALLLRERHGLPGLELTGDVPVPERKLVVERIQAGHVRAIFATGQLMGEGFDASSLSALFLTTPIKFSGRLIQYLGRVLRPGSGKARPKVFDFVDTKVGVLEAAARSRAEVYADLFGLP